MIYHYFIVNICQLIVSIILIIFFLNIITLVSKIAWVQLGWNWGQIIFFVTSWKLYCIFNHLVHLLNFPDSTRLSIGCPSEEHWWIYRLSKGRPSFCQWKFNGHPLEYTNVPLLDVLDSMKSPVIRVTVKSL